jgi:hypothetical protein
MPRIKYISDSSVTHVPVNDLSSSLCWQVVCWWFSLHVLRMFIFTGNTGMYSLLGGRILHIWSKTTLKTQNKL